MPYEKSVAVCLGLILLAPFFFTPLPSLASLTELKYASPSNVLASFEQLDSHKNIEQEGFHKVTLLTGDTVLASVAENGTVLSLTVQPADPTKLGQNFLVSKMNNCTYVIPSNIDMSRFDMELFNINLLIEEGYEELTYIPVIIDYSTDVDTFVEEVKEKGVEVTEEFLLVHSFAAKILKDKALELDDVLFSSAEIRKVWLDMKVHSTLKESVALVGAPEAWKGGYNGSGVKIAIIDTGINWTHPFVDDFDNDPSTYDPKVVMNVSFVTHLDSDPMDYHGHGTHCAGIAAGVGKAMSGVAPGAWLWDVKVLNRLGYGYTSWCIAGIEFAALGEDRMPNTGDEADVLSMSWGASRWTDGTDPLSKAVDAAVEAGRICVVAAGNEGRYFTIGTPATSRKAITVGASDKQDHLAWFSSCGPTVDFRVKPDILAPGANINSSTSRGYENKSGTSMATPHVAGLAAILRQIHPKWAPNLIKDIIVSTADKLVDIESGRPYNIYQQGGGRANISSAMDMPFTVDPAVFNLGIVTPDTLISSNLTFAFNPEDKAPRENVNLSLDVKLTDIVTGNIVQNVKLNTTTLIIAPFESTSVLLTLNTTLPGALYEGEVVASVIGGAWANRKINAIFSLVKLNNVTVKTLDRTGLPRGNIPIWMTKNVTSSLDSILNNKFAYTNRNGSTTFYVCDGEFQLLTKMIDEKTGADIWVQLNAKITGDFPIILNGSLATEVSFDPAKQNQVFASKRSSVRYYIRSYLDGKYQETWEGLMSLWYYPRTPLTFLTPTNVYASFGYEYYPMEHFKPACPNVIDTSEWGNVLYSQLGINPPVVLKANYTELVKKETDYKVPIASILAAALYEHKFNRPYEGFSASFLWISDVPQKRMEWLSPNIMYKTYYEKYRDTPWTETPWWSYYGWGQWQSGEDIYEAYGSYPLSTMFSVWNETWDGSIRLNMSRRFFQDAYGHSFSNTRRWPAGHTKIFCNDTLIYEGDESDFSASIVSKISLPSSYKVVMDGWTDVQVANTPSHAWFSGKGNNLRNTLDHVFNLTEVSSATLNFWTRYATEPRYDYGYVKVSTDGGKKWTTLATFEGQSRGYMRKSCNLTDFVGNMVILRFEYVTDYSVVYDGWYVDDIEIHEVGFKDNTEAGSRDWVTNGWTIAEQRGIIEHTELEFVVAEGIDDSCPPVIYVRIAGLDLNNTHAPGKIEGEILLEDKGAIENAMLEYSVDDGSSWSHVPLVYVGLNRYSFIIEHLGNVYLSLRVNATDEEGNRISQTTIKAFYIPSPREKT